MSRSAPSALQVSDLHLGLIHREEALQDGLYTLAADQRLYTSRGTGTWGPPMRILSPPVITLIEIAPK